MGDYYQRGEKILCRECHKKQQTKIPTYKRLRYTLYCICVYQILLVHVTSKFDRKNLIHCPCMYQVFRNQMLESWL